MGFLSLVTKPLRVIDEVAGIVEPIVDEVVDGAVDYVTGDWDGEDRKRREAQRARSR